MGWSAMPAFLTAVSCGLLCGTGARVLPAAANPSGSCWFILTNRCPFDFGQDCVSCASGVSASDCGKEDVAAYCGDDEGISFTQSVTHLSTSRRDIGATSVGGMAIFAGGCRNNGTGTAQYSCDEPDGSVDIFVESDSPPGVKLSKTSQVSEPRGWICAAPGGRDSEGPLVVLAGGGTSGIIPHSTSGDVVNLNTGAVTSFPNALSVGRWGVSCTSVGDATYFAGGKVTVSGYDDAWMSSIVDVFTAGDGSQGVGTWAPAPYNLSVARESSTAASVGGSLLVSGGWQKVDGTYQGDNTVDLFEDPVTGANHQTFQLAADAYDVGAAIVNGTAYIVANTEVATFTATGEGSPVMLPQALAGVPSLNGGGLIPGCHMPQNGVTVGPWACYYGGSTNTSAPKPALYCLHSVRQRWARLPCSVPHRAGAIALVGSSTVLVAGGFDPTADNAPASDIVDVFQFKL